MPSYRRLTKSVGTAMDETILEELHVGLSSDEGIDLIVLKPSIDKTLRYMKRSKLFFLSFFFLFFFRSLGPERGI